MLIIALLLCLASIFFAFGVGQKVSSPQVLADTLLLHPLSTATHLPVHRHAPPPPVRLPKGHTPASLSEEERSEDYVGAPTRPNQGTVSKVPAGTTFDLNAIDSIELQRVPGIGPSFARRIVKYRHLLGGYYTVLQLQEVYGMDAERYRQIKPFFRIDVAPYMFCWDSITPSSLPRHPYLNYVQMQALRRLLAHKGHISSWSDLMALPEFAPDDSVRLSHYFYFSSSLK